MGAPYMQYMLSDNIVTPPEHRAYYQEKIISLPHSYFVNDHRQSAREAAERIEMPDRARYGLPEGVFVFCCFNQLYKVDPSIFDVWMRLLKRVPDSVLWLLRFPPSGEDNILKEVCRCGYELCTSRMWTDSQTDWLIDCMDGGWMSWLSWSHIGSISSRYQLSAIHPL